MYNVGFVTTRGKRHISTVDPGDIQHPFEPVLSDIRDSPGTKITGATFSVGRYRDENKLKGAELLIKNFTSELLSRRHDEHFLLPLVFTFRITPEYLSEDREGDHEAITPFILSLPCEMVKIVFRYQHALAGPFLPSTSLMHNALLQKRLLIYAPSVEEKLRSLFS